MDMIMNTILHWYVKSYSSVPNKCADPNKHAGWNFDKKSNNHIWTNFDQNTKKQSENWLFYSQ